MAESFRYAYASVDFICSSSVCVRTRQLEAILSGPMMKLAEELKREKEEKITALQIELICKEILEWEIRALKGTIKLWRDLNEEGDLVAENEMTSIEQELKNKQEELDGLKQKEEMLAKYNEELEMMQQKELEHLDTIFGVYKTSKQRLDDQLKELKLRENELRQLEKLNESLKRKLDREKEMNERAILAQKKADETMMKLAEVLKREKEQALEKIIVLQRELDQKQALEMEIETLKRDIKVMRHMNEEGDLAAKNKLTSIEEELKDKQEEHDYLENINNELIIKQLRENDQLQEVRKALINGLKDTRGNICVKRMGELDVKPFIRAAKQTYSKEEAPGKALELCSLWEDHLRDPHWHPFKVIKIGEKDVGVIDEEDEKLVGLKNEYGDKLYKAVTTALMELNEYNSSGRFPVAELWNTEEKRRAELKEVVEHILKQWRRLKNRKS